MCRIGDLLPFAQNYKKNEIKVGNMENVYKLISCLNIVLSFFIVHGFVIGNFMVNDQRPFKDNY